MKLWVLTIVSSMVEKNMKWAQEEKMSEASKKQQIPLSIVTSVT